MQEASGLDTDKTMIRKASHAYDDPPSTPRRRKRKVHFSNQHLHHEMYSPSDYDRTSYQPTRGRLNAGGHDAIVFRNEVRNDLVTYKLGEMEVHDKSRDNVDLSIFREETRRQMIQAKLAGIRAAASEPKESRARIEGGESQQPHCERVLGFYKIGSRLDSWIQWHVSNLGFEIS